jgi:hypothetical protein
MRMRRERQVLGDAEIIYSYLGGCVIVALPMCHTTGFSLLPAACPPLRCASLCLALHQRSWLTLSMTGLRNGRQSQARSPNIEQHVATFPGSIGSHGPPTAAFCFPLASWYVQESRCIWVQYARVHSVWAGTAAGTDEISVAALGGVAAAWKLHQKSL